MAADFISKLRRISPDGPLSPTRARTNSWGPTRPSSFQLFEVAARSAAQDQLPQGGVWTRNHRFPGSGKPGQVQFRPADRQCGIPSWPGFLFARYKRLLQGPRSDAFSWAWFIIFRASGDQIRMSNLLNDLHMSGRDSRMTGREPVWGIGRRVIPVSPGRIDLFVRLAWGIQCRLGAIGAIMSFTLSKLFN